MTPTDTKTELRNLEMTVSNLSLDEQAILQSKIFHEFRIIKSSGDYKQLLTNNQLSSEIKKFAENVEAHLCNRDIPRLVRNYETYVKVLAEYGLVIPATLELIARKNGNGKPNVGYL